MDRDVDDNIPKALVCEISTIQVCIMHELASQKVNEMCIVYEEKMMRLFYDVKLSTSCPCKLVLVCVPYP